jgi:hypothetical protein
MVHPDSELDTRQHGTILFVSRNALLEAMVDAAAVLDMAGGVLTVVCGRHPTDVPGEMVTTSAVVEWKDRTDAREQPEQAGPPKGAPAPQVGAQILEHMDPDLRADLRAALEAEVREQMDAAAAQQVPAMVGGPRPEIGDGLDRPLEEEDVSSIPESLR